MPATNLLRARALRIRVEGESWLEIADTEAPATWSGVEVSPRGLGIEPPRGLRGRVTAEVLEAPAGIKALEGRAPSGTFASRLQVFENSEWLVKTPGQTFQAQLGGFGAREALRFCGLDHGRLLSLEHAIGEVAIQTRGLALPLLVLSYKLPGADPTKAIEELTLWVWERHLALLRRQGNPTAAAVDAGRRRARSPVQTLLLVEHLLQRECVEEAWQALLREPRRSLRIDWPVRSPSEARHPALHGPRGPWSLPGAFSADGGLRRVRDRVPTHTADTPPMRLAWRLAERVASLTQQLVERFEALGERSWAARAGKLLGRARQVHGHPSLEEANLAAPLPLESPVLQLDPPSRVLLRAWAQLDQGLTWPDDVEALFRDPLRTSFELYEYAAWFALIEALRRHTRRLRLHPWLKPHRDAVESASLRQGARVEFELRDGRRGHLLYNADPGPSGYSSWTLGFRPDYALQIDGGSLQLFDAKYKRTDEAKDEDVKAMHAYRDVLRDPSGKRAEWATLVYPQSGGSRWREPAPGRGGIAAVAWTPESSSALEAWLAELLA